jgi:hypothetical protein
VLLNSKPRQRGTQSTTMKGRQTLPSKHQ